ncbi:hypothetical protein A5658_07610 [Mycobacterium sp. 1245111.1]|uniref:hypothetical protein n=1 Tax=Mycobacterium sp. 1245111.1 TaxID=1834073 RepID=UPI0007FC6F12|nr:hypothetical protein [Mycobacterium sp. 1245111.1]OBK35293.1 hypothetical protein A5658_07610 [Mycobacterium sp. 1245111.1]
MLRQPYRSVGRVAAEIAVLLYLTATAIPAGARADYQVPQPLPVFEPHPSEWQPNYSAFPYNVWQSHVTVEQVNAERESCQWFDAQYDQLMGQVLAFQHALGDHHDVWSAPGIQPSGDTVVANVDRSAAFLDTRVHTLYVVNYDKNQYSPLYQGDSLYHLWYQLTQISAKMRQRDVSGVINANIAIANVYGNTIRDSTVCNGA